ncbi:hypothetical protein RJ55_07982 [Drechmeria coniospora]|nr:hypothetical protein RJ55_07982 [Drechmeria coniospora]
MLRQRRDRINLTRGKAADPSSAAAPESTTTEMADANVQAALDLGGRDRRNRWIFLAMASGACAALNGVFAKLTTTSLTTSVSRTIAGFLGISSGEKVVEAAVRGSFFALNLVFNGIMWTLFTAALAKGTSTTQVSIVNTSTNFVLTALLGLALFAEALPPLWWAGAALLVAGNVIVGAKDETEDAPGTCTAQSDLGEPLIPLDDPNHIVDECFVDEDVADLGNLPRNDGSPSLI